MRKGNEKEWKISSVLTADISGRKIMKRDHLAIGCQDALMIFLPVKRKSTKTLTVTLSGRKEDTMTVEKLQRANELKEELHAVNSIMEMLNSRLDYGKPDTIQLDYIKFHCCDCRPAERLHDIPPEICKEIALVLRNYYLKKQTELTKEW